VSPAGCRTGGVLGAWEAAVYFARNTITSRSSSSGRSCGNVSDRHEATGASSEGLGISAYNGKLTLNLVWPAGDAQARMSATLAREVLAPFFRLGYSHLSLRSPRRTNWLKPSALPFRPTLGLSWEDEGACVQTNRCKGWIEDLDRLAVRTREPVCGLTRPPET